MATASAVDENQTTASGEGDTDHDGIDLSFVYTGDLFGNLSGGVATGARYEDNATLSLMLDGQKLWNWPGVKFYGQLGADFGGQIDRDLIRSYGIVDNNEADRRGLRLNEIWAEKTFGADRAYSLRIGVEDVNDEFDVTDSTANFVHSNFGLDNEFALSGRQGVPTFPYNALAARLRWDATSNLYLEGWISDGAPGDPPDSDGVHLSLGGHQGALLLSEIGRTYGRNGEDGKIAVGAYRYTSALAGYDDPAERHHPGGFYGLGEAKLWQDPAVDSRHLTGFLRGGYADPQVDPFVLGFSTGFVVTAPLASRPDSEFGAGAHFDPLSAQFRKPHDGNAMNQQADEGGLELYYLDKPASWLTLQPDAQYILNPGANPKVGDAWLIGLRAKIEF